MKDIFLVDADDTVLDFHGVSTLAIRAAFNALSLTWKEEYEAEYRIINNALWEALERKEITREELMDTRFLRYLAHLGIEADGVEFNKKYIEYLSKNPRYLEGAEAFLRKLRSMGRIYIVTNGTEYIQRSRFTIAKLWELADGVFISQTAGADKPAKTYTDYVIAHIDGFEKDRAVWIGDSLSADIKAANDAGIVSIWFNPHKKSESATIRPDYTVGGYEEIVHILRKINADK